MKRFVLTLATLITLLPAAFAQTPEEIIANMDKAMASGETEGMAMALDMKIPIIGTSTMQFYMLGDKVKSETTIMGHKLITFSDGKTDYEYDTIKNELKISDATPGGENSGSEAELFQGITQGYDVTMKSETAEAWYLVCKKSRNNKEKDDPDKMELVVSKATNLPISLSTKMSGIKITLRDVKIGVPESQLHFDPNDYPDAKVIDERKK